jgi:hypothetical protein
MSRVIREFLNPNWVPDSFLPEKPWVAMEAFFLAVRSLVRGNVLIIPVTVGDVAQRLRTERQFEPAQTSEIQWIECPIPHNQTALTQVIERICTALASVKPNQHMALSGLAKAIARILAAHPDAHAALAAAFEPAVQTAPRSRALACVRSGDVPEAAPRDKDGGASCVHDDALSLERDVHLRHD